MKIRKAVIPAAGLGTRFLPATKNQPKEMLPVVDKPVIQYVVEEAAASGIEFIVLITGRGKGAIENHFDYSVELERTLERRKQVKEIEALRAISNLVDIAYIRQKEALGLGHAILQARHLVGDEPFGVFLGDDIIASDVPCMAQLADAYEKHQAPVLAVQEVPEQDLSKYGVVGAEPLDGNHFKVTALAEKPAPGTAPGKHAIIGRYVLTPDIFPILERTPPDAKGEIQLTAALQELHTRRPIVACAFEGKRYDTGDRIGYLTANIEFALNRDDVGPAIAAFIKQKAKELP